MNSFLLDVMAYENGSRDKTILIVFSFLAPHSLKRLRPSNLP